MAADISSRARAVSHGTRDSYALSIPKIGISYQAFNALDEVVFAGKFKDAVFLEFKGVCPTSPEQPTFPAIILTSEYPNCHRSEQCKHKEAILDQIFASLLHRMIHAYFLIACGPQHCDEPKGGRRLRHDNHFGKIIYTIKNLSAASPVRAAISGAPGLSLPTYSRLNWTLAFCLVYAPSQTFSLILRRPQSSRINLL